MRSYRLIHTLAIMAFLGSSLFVLAGCAGKTEPVADQRNTEPATAAPTTNQNVTGGTEDTDAGTEESADSTDGGGDVDESRTSIDISNFAFSPTEVRIKAGTTVVWTNKDTAPHQVHADDDVYQLEIINEGGRSEQLYTAPGTYTYHCHVHPNMKATVIVE